MAMDCKGIFMMLTDEDVSIIDDSNYYSNISKSKITVLSTLDATQYSLDFLLLFDIILSKNPINEEKLNVYKSEKLNSEQEKRLKLMLGKHVKWENLIRVLPGDDNESFYKSCTDYIEKLVSDKTDEQLSAISCCFFCAKSEDTDSVLNEESIQFFKLIKQIGD